MIDLGPCPHHAITETYCDECGVPNSSNQHGMDCSHYPIEEEAMTELTTWLLERIAAEEAVARAAQELGVTTWYTERRDVRGRQLLQGVSEDHPDFDEDVDVFTAATRNHAAHIARHDPARVLAECAAKRRIVEHPPYQVEEGADSNSAFEQWELTLRALASVYAGQPGWREEWA